ncbi:MAG: contractile injection system tape measure protein [Bacteroidia bacterium]
MTGPHTIRKQVFDLNCRDAGRGKVLLGRVEEMYWERILPAIERVFDEMSLEGEEVVIDRLEIDLGDVTDGEFEQNAAGLIAQALRRVIREAMSKVGTGMLERPEVLDGTGLHAGLAQDSGPYARSHAAHFPSAEGREAAIRRMGNKQGQWEALVSFLETGLLPWWAVAEAFKPWEAFLEVARIQPERFAAFLRMTVGRSSGSGAMSVEVASADVITRIAGAGDARVFPMALELLLGDHAKIALAMLGLVLHPSNAGMGFQANEIWRVRSGMLAAGLMDGWGPAFLSRWEEATGLDASWSRLVDGLGAIDSSGGKPRLKETVPELGSREEVVLELFGEWLVRKRAARELRGSEEEGNGNSNEGGAADQPSIVMRKPGMPPTDASPSKRKRPAHEPKLPEEIFVPNAGLVLVAAFLPMFFEHLGLLEGGQFRDEAAQQRAVLLLSVLSRGLNVVDEPELAMEKLLAGLPISAPLDMSIPPSETDLEDADALLQSVIMNWSVLGDVSPDQLRGGFLLREGVLQANGRNWKLRVDRKGYDVVLERLPWSISIVSHPWMEGIVFVEW